ncbi:IS66 family transposase [Alkalicoccus chagannorensis]|uniref:IS66 family transposase n=1 Tax=Alkalicoccus chagannorensis TaxID=427072 RepID=UPI00041256E1|nr:transposase [Alkalicoccus chagannorensis]
MTTCHASRKHEAPLAFLEGFEGTLFADAHVTYRKVAEKQPGISLAGCWAHARRKFVEATHGNSGSGISHDGVAWIGKIYDLHHAYLRYLLETLPNLPSLEPDVLKEYLPWAPAMQEAFVFRPE